jgi:hypothetical protein
MARVQVLLTDAPADYLAVAEVCISQVYLQPGEGEESPRTVLWDKGEGDAQCFDLLELQGVSAAITPSVEVAAGTYEQLRLIVESASVTLAEGYTFADGVETTMDLSVPSGAETGIKVQLLESVHAEATELTEITVDADVNQNFVIQGDPDTPAGIQGVLFTPHLVQIEVAPWFRSRSRPAAEAAIALINNGS